MSRRQIIILALIFLLLGAVQVGARLLTSPEYGQMLSEGAYNWLTALTVVAGGLVLFLGTASTKQQP